MASRGKLVFEAHRLVYHLILGSRVIKKRKKKYLDLDFEKGGRVRLWLRLDPVERGLTSDSVDLSSDYIGHTNRTLPRTTRTLHYG